MGVGTKSKRKGFLARGGAGGPPVFMGVGYVEGAEEDEDDGEEDDDDGDGEYYPGKSGKVAGRSSNKPMASKRTSRR